MNIVRIVGLALVVLGAALGFFLDIPQGDIISVAVAVFGAMLTVVSIIKKQSKRDWKTYAGFAAIIVGAALAAVGGVTESALTAIIGAVFVLLGLLVSVIRAKK